MASLLDFGAIKSVPYPVVCPPSNLTIKAVVELNVQVVVRMGQGNFFFVVSTNMDLPKEANVLLVLIVVKPNKARDLAFVDKMIIHIILMFSKDVR
ncbi:hypothetical protein MMC17_003513 [Xylographa soralifera]|nr:hypothetical protein [Xylographa soralifera]